MTAYYYPASIREAVACLADHDGQARIIAGGTDLLPDMREGVLAPRCLVDITRIPELQRIELDCDAVTVGAAVTFREIREHAFMRRRVHALVDAAGSVGAAAIQNTATWIGNIVQAMPAADGAIVAVALDAEAQIVGPAGRRWEPVESLFRGPGLSSVDPGRDLVTYLRFRRPRAGTGTAWSRIGRRSALVLPILNCAVRVELEPAGGVGSQASKEECRVANVAIALGPVAPHPTRAREAEAFLRGRVLRPDILRRAGEIARGEANPRSSTLRASREYRLAVLPGMVNEALCSAVNQACREVI